MLCSGKVYYDLLEEREKRGIDDVYLLRVEQLYPFPAKALVNELSRFRNAEMVWCQEEPKNMGAWSFVEPYLEWVLDQIGAQAPARRAMPAARPSASPATGLMSQAPGAAAGIPRRRARRLTLQRTRRQRKETDQWQPKSAFPTLGESVTEATVGHWFKKAGDAVKADEPLVELETDKVTVEVPAPAAGVLAETSPPRTATRSRVGALLGVDRRRRRGAPRRRRPQPAQAPAPAHPAAADAGAPQRRPRAGRAAGHAARAGRRQAAWPRTGPRRRPGRRHRQATAR